MKQRRALLKTSDGNDVDPHIKLASTGVEDLKVLALRKRHHVSESSHWGHDGIRQDGYPSALRFLSIGMNLGSTSRARAAPGADLQRTNDLQLDREPASGGSPDWGCTVIIRTRIVATGGLFSSVYLEKGASSASK